MPARERIPAVDLESILSEVWMSGLPYYRHAMSKCPSRPVEWEDDVYQALNPIVIYLLAWAVRVNCLQSGIHQFPHTFQSGGPINASFKDDELLAGIEISVFGGVIYASCELTPESSIPNQDDKWWAIISEIALLAPTKIEGFCLQTQSDFNHRTLFKSGRALAFQIVRNYCIRQLDPVQEIAGRQCLICEISIEMPFEDVKVMIKRIVKHYLDLRRGLRRSEYLKNRRKPHNSVFIG